MGVSATVHKLAQVLLTMSREYERVRTNAIRSLHFQHRVIKPGITEVFSWKRTSSYCSGVGYVREKQGGALRTFFKSAQFQASLCQRLIVISTGCEMG